MPNPGTSSPISPIFGIGGVGGALGLSRAADHVLAYPERSAVLLAVELCSLTIQRDDLSVANFIAGGLAGSGKIDRSATAARDRRQRNRKPPPNSLESAADGAPAAPDGPQ
jgi:alkylresorcinol/alkylpyrone synthase